MRICDLLNIGKKNRSKNQHLKIFLCLFFTILILFNILYTNNIYTTNFSEEILSPNIEDYNESNPNSLSISTGASMLQSPFTENLDALHNFFESKYQSSLFPSITAYFRTGDRDGDITDDTIFSEDNLLLYKSLMEPENNKTETFDIYLNLKETLLWYEGDYNQFKYGFVKSVDESTGQVLDDDRYLVDNLLPIFLLIENIGEDIDDIVINGKKPEDAIDEMFYLINSTEFWEDDSSTDFTIIIPQLRNILRVISMLY